jgi:hypothetical protein
MPAARRKAKNLAASILLVLLLDSFSGSWDLELYRPSPLPVVLERLGKPWKGLERLEDFGLPIPDFNHQAAKGTKAKGDGRAAQPPPLPYVMSKNKTRMFSRRVDTLIHRARILAEEGKNR